MKAATTRLFNLLFAMVAITVALPVRAASQQKLDKDRFVIVISLDGFPAYALDDPKLPVPTLRKMMHEGTVAASMKPVNPTVTWPNHTAMVTGVDASRHQVLFNGLLTRKTSNGVPSIEPWRDKEVMVKTATIYDVAHQAGLTTAQVDWVAIFHAQTIDWQFPELPDPNGEIEKAMMAKGIVTRDQLEKFEDSSQAWQDQMWTSAALEILDNHRPNLLLLHLLTVDDINHKYGPMSPAGMTAMAFVDLQVKRIVDALRSNGNLQRTTILIVSDHGFSTVTRKIHPNALLRHAGLITGPPGQEKGQAWVVAEGGSAMVFLGNVDGKADLVHNLRQLLESAEGVDHLYETEDFPKFGLPTHEQSDQAPDFVLTARPGYVFDNDSSENSIAAAAGGTHGYPNTDPQMQAIFIAWGAGIPAGVHLPSISNLDVAPTIAALLGIEFAQAQGHAIPNLLK